MFLACASACAHAVIEGTHVRDTADNRGVYKVLAEVISALEGRDLPKLLSHISTRYFEDNGTPDPHDDYGYAELQERLLKDSLNPAKEFYIAVQVHDIQVNGDYGFADIRYSTRTRLDFPSGRLWDNHRDFDRIEFVRENHVWRVVSGL